MPTETITDFIAKCIALSFGFTGLILSVSKDWIRERSRFKVVFLFAIVLIFLFSGILFWAILNIDLGNFPKPEEEHIQIIAFFVVGFFILSSSLHLWLAFSMDHRIHVAMTPDLGARALFNYGKNASIIYSHRKELVRRCNEKIYIESGIPVDEAKLVYRIMHWACSSPEIKEHKTYCSCKFKHEEQYYWDELPGENDKSFIDLIKEEFGMEWGNSSPRIKKSPSKDAIEIYDNENDNKRTLIELKFNKEKVNIEIKIKDDKRPIELKNCDKLGKNDKYGICLEKDDKGMKICKKYYYLKDKKSIEIARNNLVLIGINEVSRDCLEKIIKDLKYKVKYDISKEIDAFVEVNDYNKIKETATGKFYGLVSRGPNPYDNGRSSVFFASGSHRKGQEAITKWISNPENLARITPDKIGFFQLLLSGYFFKLLGKECILICQVEDKDIIPIYRDDSAQR